jgi:O-antigen/teichoic acid export membrane protein
MNTFFSYSAAIFFPRLCGYLTAYIFSRLLSVHDFGLYVLAIAIGKFCDYSTGVWFRNGFLRVYHPGNIATPGAKPRISSMYLVSLGCSAVGILMTWPICYFLGHAQWISLGYVTTIYIIGDGALQATLYTLRGETRPRSYAVVESLRPLLSMGAGILAVKFAGPTFLSAGFGLLGCNMLVSIIAFTVICGTRAKKKNIAEKDYVVETFQYAWPLIIGCFLVASMNVIDRYQLQWWLGPSAVALYAAAYSIGRQPIDILLNGMNLSAFTQFMKTYDIAGPEAASELLRRQILLILGVVFPIGAGLSVLAPDILHVLYDARYWNNTPMLVPTLALIGLMAGLKNFVFDQGFYMVRKLNALVLSFLPAFIVGTGCSILFIKMFGLPGAAYGELAGFLISLLFAAHLMKRFLPVQLPWASVGKLFVSALTMTLVMSLMESQMPASILSFTIKVIVGLGTYMLALLFFDMFGMRQHLQKFVVWLNGQVRLIKA